MQQSPADILVGYSVLAIMAFFYTWEGLEWISVLLGVMLVLVFILTSLMHTQVQREQLIFAYESSHRLRTLDFM